MDMFNNVIESIKYRTNYFESFSEYNSYLNNNNESHLNIICFNIRSVNAHFDELLLFLENDVNNKKIDIIVLTETWHNSLFCHYMIPGYSILFSSTKRNQNDGIIIFVKNHLNADFYDYDFLEYNIVKLSLIINNVPITIVCIYRSPSSDSIGFINSLKYVFNNLNLNSGIITLIGDMNINIIGAQTVNNYDYLDLLSETGFYSFINVFTRLPLGQQHSCLDHVFIKDNNNSLGNINAGVLLTDITDHCSIVVTIPIPVKIKNIINTINVINYDKLKQMLYNEKWTKIYESNSVDVCTTNFQNTIMNAIKKSLTTKNINSKNKRLKEWMTKGLLCSVRRKQYISMKCKKNPNNVSLASYYKKYKNTFTKLLKVAKIKFYEDKFSKVSYNPKLTWKLINEITGSNPKNNDKIKTVIMNDKILNIDDNPKEVSNVFNNYFTDVGKNLAKNFNKTHNLVLNKSNDNILCSFDKIFLEKIDVSELRIIIQNFKDDTSAGYDNITVKIFKSISELIITPLVYIFNLSLENSIFPDKFKFAIIKPLFKSGDRKTISNYRPISMLTNFSKIFEKIIKTRLLSYLEKNNLLSKSQYGFRPGLSTENALYNATQFMYDSLDKGLKTIAIFIDLAKAFDTIQHDILLRILPNFGINNKSLLWFKSYLSNRQQMVKINDAISNTNYIEYGVPQGSVLGPILFILYINAVCDLNIDGKIVTYADDTCLLFSDKCWEGVYLKATKGLQLTYECISELGLTINSDKTTYMKFSINKITDDNFPLIIHNCQNQLICNMQNCKQINQVSKIRYLGIIFDNNLRWNLHIHNLVGKLRYSLHKFILLKEILPVETLRTIYFAFYQSICQYGILVWGGAKENVLKILQTNQNNILRIILNRKSLVGSTKVNYIKLGVLPIRYLYKKYAILFTIKKFTNLNNNNRHLRDHIAYNLPVTYSKKSFGQSFIDYLGPTYFNQMPTAHKKNIHGGLVNEKKVVYKWLFSELITP